MKHREFNSEDYEFLRNDVCPECGEDGHLGVWLHKPTGQETKYCYTEGCDYKVTTASLYRSSQPGNEPSDKLILYLLGDAVHAPIVKKFRVTQEGRLVYFGFAHPNGKLDGYMVRNYNVPKSDKQHFFWKKKSSLLYGMDTCHKDGSLIIVSGYMDAIAAHIMTGGMNCVSLTNGDKSVRKCLQDNWSWLHQFSKIYTVFDNDVPGQDAAMVAKEMLGFRVRNVVLPDLVIQVEDKTVALKDSRDFLKYGFRDAFKAALEAADMASAEYKYGEELDKQFSDYIRVPIADRGWSTGIPELDVLIKFRPHECTVMFGAPGRGKSTLARFFTRVVSDQVRVYLISMEDPPWIAMENLVHLFYDSSILYDEFGKLLPSDKELQQLSKEVRQRLTIARVEDSDPNVFEQYLEAAIVTDNCRFIVLDHITWLLNLHHDPREAAVKFMNVISNTVKRYPVHILVISHTRPTDMAVAVAKLGKGKNIPADWEEHLPPTMRDAQWSSVFEQIAWNVIGIKKPDGDYPTMLHVLKNRVGGINHLGKVPLFYNPKTRKFVGVLEHFNGQIQRQEGVEYGQDGVYRRHPNQGIERPGAGDSGTVQPFDNEEHRTFCPIYPESGKEDECHRTESDLPEAWEEGRDASVVGADAVLSPQIQASDVPTGFLLPSNKLSDRIQRQHDGRLSHESYNLQNAASSALQRLQAIVSESRFDNTKRTEEHSD